MGTAPGIEQMKKTGSKVKPLFVGKKWDDKFAKEIY
jgi:hypothetical protein